MHVGKYNIKAASKILGIPSGTLRAWERRYHFIAPDRNESGHRLYSDKQIHILKGLIEKTKQGFTISQAVALLDREDDPETEQEISLPAVNQTNELSEKLLSALLVFDEDKAHSIINQVFSLFTVEKAVIDIIGSILVKIGELWEKGEITSAHEHFASSILQSRVSFIMHTQPANPLMPKAVMVCGPEEKHELGLLIFTLYMRRKGYGTVYLGPSLAEGDINTVLDVVKPGYLFISCTMEDCYRKTVAMLPMIKEKYPDLIVGLGGTGFSSKAGLDIDNDFFVGDTLTQWNKWLLNR